MTNQGQVTSDEEYRAQANAAQFQADRAKSPLDREAWLRMAPDCSGLDEPDADGIAPVRTIPVRRIEIELMARRPRDLSDKLSGRRDRRKTDDGFTRETFSLPIDEARAKAREVLSRYPAGAYMTVVDKWRQLDDGRIEFTMRRLPTAD